MKLISLIIIFLGALVIGLHAYDYVNSDLSDHWFSSVIIAIFAIIAGFFIRKGYSLNPQPELSIDTEGIKLQKTSMWDKSVKWTALKAVSLDKNNIHIQYHETGAHDKIQLPVYTESQCSQIEQQLKEAASEFDLEFRKK
ncbi:hypothetical protein NC796_12725 [Aliifodinibius sp. S!AR15-10]|uniref:hypothetical protein n=1 Tax=Aliifodinibius sp. S!AR15-10 TaxID=2950437 RepID=UPI00285D235F|nr:hypothetical protein [Aliifodinibius sp. S!AR15-10]MDR8392013.1 hypothetical protein [Aliifodinibius sp. S!AR15-10]